MALFILKVLSFETGLLDRHCLVAFCWSVFGDFFIFAQGKTMVSGAKRRELLGSDGP